MTNTTADVLVVGGGVMGCAAAYAAARAGQRVRLIEKFTIGHTNGSSHGGSRIIRVAYDTQGYVDLARAAFAQWRELESQSGAALLQTMGGLDFGAPDAHMLAGIGAQYRAAGLPFEALDGAEIMRRYPQLALPEGTVGFYQPDYALLAANRCVATLAERATAHGAILHEDEPVLEIKPTASGGVEVRTGRATYSAGRAILAAGAWMRPMLKSLGLDVPLVVTKEASAVFRPGVPADFMPGRFPIFIHRFPHTSVLGAGFPIYGHEGVKMLMIGDGRQIDPEIPDRGVDAPYMDRVRNYAAAITPGLTGEVIEEASCLYTTTPDEHFIIDRHPQYSQIVVGSPCSGHGFKFGVVIGRILADLALRGGTGHDIGRFRLDRPALRLARKS